MSNHLRKTIDQSIIIDETNLDELQKIIIEKQISKQKREERQMIENKVYDVVSFKETKFDMIMKHHVLEVIRSNSITSLIEIIWFNKFFPEYQNAYTTTSGSAVCNVYDNHWKLIPTNEVIEHMYESVMNQINAYFFKFTKERQKQLLAILTAEPKEVTKMKSDIRGMLFNKRGIVLANIRRKERKELNDRFVMNEVQNEEPVDLIPNNVVELDTYDSEKRFVVKKKDGYVENDSVIKSEKTSGRIIRNG
jgi:hypothetical protein